MDTSNVEEYLAEVRAFADKIGMREKLEEQLQYLDTYANRRDINDENKDNDKTECRLFKDFAPYSFAFTVYRRPRKFSLHVHRCETCGKEMKSEESYHEKKCFLWNEDTRSECGGVLRVVGVEHHEQKTCDYWFNGGLIFHGPHDNGGDGGMPTLSVNLLPHHGWSIHT